MNVGSEWHHQKDVDAEFLGQLGAPGQCRQLGRVATGVDHFHRVRIERHQHRRHSACATRFDRVFDQLSMPTVQSVEHADGEHTSAPVGRDLVLAAPPLHNCQPTVRGNAVIVREPQIR